MQLVRRRRIDLLIFNVLWNAGNVKEFGFWEVNESTLLNVDEVPPPLESSGSLKGSALLDALDKNEQHNTSPLKVCDAALPLKHSRSEMLIKIRKISIAFLGAQVFCQLTVASTLAWTYMWLVFRQCPVEQSASSACLAPDSHCLGRTGSRTVEGGTGEAGSQSRQGRQRAGLDIQLGRCSGGAGHSTAEAAGRA